MNKDKKRLSKRGKLYLANICGVIALIIVGIIEIAASSRYSMLTYIFLLCLFVFLSLIVYYLSIIADTLKERNENQENLQNKK